MPIAGVPPGALRGSKAGHLAGELAGQRHSFSVAKQTLKAPTGVGGGSVYVGTLLAEIASVPLRGLLFTAPKVHGHEDATMEVNVSLDGQKLLASDQSISSPGGTVTVSPDQNRQSTSGTYTASRQKHDVRMLVNKVYGHTGGTAEVTPTVTVLHDD